MPCRRFGILTGGGDAPALNAVIRAVSKTLFEMLGEDNVEVIGFLDGFEGVIELNYRMLHWDDVSGILDRGGTILGTSNRANPFGYFRRDGADVSDEVVAHCKELGIECLFVIGGDGTMSISHRLHAMGLACVGIPKTIDNDLHCTERTFGFDTAVSIATKATNRLGTTAESHHRVMLLETMGRYAGWIALHTGLASGVDVVLVPEFPYEVARIAEVIERRKRQGKRSTVIVVAEGARPVGGSFAVRQVDPTSPDPLRLGGVAQVLANELASLVDSETRATVLGHTQRGGCPTALDRILATSYGTFAAYTALHGETGVMVALVNNRLATSPLPYVPVEQAQAGCRCITQDSPLVAAALSLGVSFGCAMDEPSFGEPGSRLHVL